MTVSTLQIGKKKFAVVPFRDFEQLRRKADLLTSQDAADARESLKRLNDPKQKRVSWEQIKARGL